MILRSFLFLDISTVSDYLSALEGSLSGSTVDETSIQRNTRGGKANLKIVEGSMDGETSTERKQKRVITDAANFQKLYELLEEQSLIQALDAFDEAIWNQLRPKEILEIEATIRLPDTFAMLSATDDFTSFIQLSKTINPTQSIDPNFDVALDGMRAIAESSNKQPIPLLFEAISTPDFQFVTKLPRQYMRCNIDELQGEATVFGKIQRIIPRGQKVEAFSILPNSLRALSTKDRNEKARMERNATSQNLSETVDGPAMVIVPIAIYR